MAVFVHILPKIGLKQPSIFFLSNFMLTNIEMLYYMHIKIRLLNSL